MKSYRNHSDLEVEHEMMSAGIITACKSALNFDSPKMRLLRRWANDMIKTFAIMKGNCFASRFFRCLGGRIE